MAAKGTPRPGAGQGWLRLVWAVVALAGLGLTAYALWTASPIAEGVPEAAGGLTAFAVAYRGLGAPARRVVGALALAAGVAEVPVAVVVAGRGEVEAAAAGLALAASGALVLLGESTPGEEEGLLSFAELSSSSASDAPPSGEGSAGIDWEIEGPVDDPNHPPGLPAVPDVLAVVRDLRERGELEEAKARLSEALDLLEAYRMGTEATVEPEVYKHLAEVHRELGNTLRERSVLERFVQHGLQDSEHALMNRLAEVQADQPDQLDPAPGP